MFKKLIKRTIEEMIINGELKFSLDKGEYEAISPNGQYAQLIPTIILKVTDKNNSPLSISVVSSKEVMWELSDL